MLLKNSIGHRASREQSGFTLIEALVVISIIAITSALILPGMSGFISDGRVSANVNEFISAMTLARVEAVKRGRLVTICRSANADSASPSCVGSGADWASGWLVFEESTTTGGTVGTYESPEVIILRRGSLTNGMMAQASPAVASMTFNSLGEQVGSATATLTMDFAMQTRSPRRVCINRNGRVRVIQKPTSGTTC